MIKKLQQRDGDTGSTSVQGTILTSLYLHVLGIHCHTEKWFQNLTLPITSKYCLMSANDMR